MTLVVIIVLLALLFDFINGMNDAANSIATIVSTRVLSPRNAVLWAAFFNVAAAFFFGLHIANTIGKGVIDVSIVDSNVILAALVGAIGWSHFCTHYGIPISVSHALIGGLAGSALPKGGIDALVLGGLYKIAMFIILSPLLGMLLGFISMALVLWIVRGRSPSKVDHLFRFGQLLSSAAYSLGHGTNDAQKTMGVIALTLYSAGLLGPTFYVPIWVVFAAYAAIGLGTYLGGWKVVKTMGMKLTDLRPVHGFCAETSSAVVLFGTAAAGIPVSTTHTIAGAIMGVGSTRRLSAVRWGVAGRIVWAWVLTVPASAALAAGCYLLVIAVRNLLGI